MTDKDIIQALECCTHKNDKACFDCPLRSYSGVECLDVMLPNALDLIKRLKEVAK